MKALRYLCILGLLAVLVAASLIGFTPARPAHAVSPDLVISQVYGGGGNTGAPYNRDFVEIFNRGTSSVNLSTYSIQYASATGAGNFSANPVVALSGTLAAGQYYLVGLASGAIGAALPTPDATGTTNMSGVSGKVIIANTTSGIACNGSVGQPCSPAQLAQIVDLAGYGTANFFEGAAAAPTLSNTTAAFRAANGCTDTDQNGTNFSAAAPAPRNTATTLAPCVTDTAPSVTTTTPANSATGVAVSANVDITFSEAVNASDAAFDITCATSGGHTFTPVTTPATTFTLDPSANFTGGELCTVTVLAASVTDVDSNDPPNNMAANYVFTFTIAAPDTAPTVSSTTPADNATGVASTANLDITFNEAVNVSGSWFTISCATTGTHAATVTGGPTTYTLDPSTDFTGGELCTVTIENTLVADQDLSDPPDNMAADYVFDFTTSNVCGAPATLIHDIQGNGASTPVSGQVRTVQGIVVGDFQGAGTVGLQGFFVQEENADADADPNTSEGIFVFDTTSPAVAVALGDVVRVTGTVIEFSGLTEMTSPSRVVQVCSSGATLPTAISLTLPNASLTALETVEGMHITYSQTLTVTEVFTLARFGELLLSSGGRLWGATHIAEPGAPALAVQAANDLNQILLDDGKSGQNPDPFPYMFDEPTLRVGYTTTGIEGVMHYAFSVYRVQPIVAPTFVKANPRTPTPTAVNGTLRIASFNVLNYFNGDGAGGGFPTARGANTATEFTRQRDKTIPALVALDGDVVGLMEMENDDTAAEYGAIEDLVAGLNAATAPGTYAFIDTGVVGTDAIRVAILYQPAKVTPVGTWQTTTAGPFTGFSRPPIAQAFEEIATGEQFIVVVNHFKSKGSACAGDPDLGDGAGNCNLTRVASATELLNWLATDPTGANDSDILMVGDYNAYAKEDPIDTLVAGGFTDLLAATYGSDAYSYVFDGTSGYLDYAFASATLLDNITGITEWHINTDESIALDYNVEFKSVAQQAINLGTPYRSSDHDPVLVGLSLGDLLINGSFEDDDDTNLLPDFWKGSNLALNASRDGQDCIEAFDGACSMRITGSREGKKIKQQVLVSGDAGDDFTLTFYSKGDAVPSSGKYRVVVKVSYTNGTKETFKLNLPTGTNDWTLYSLNFSPTKPYNKIEVRFEYNKTSGTVWFDNAALSQD